MMERLTPRERQIVHCRCVRGMSYAQIGADIGMTGHTVKQHLSHIYSKLHLRGGSPGGWLCYMYGLADATRVFPVNHMRAEAV